MKEITFYLEPSAAAESDWRHKANCRDINDPDIFFPMGTNDWALGQVEAAKAICQPCPVRKQCLNWAITTHQEIGVWGGLSEEERKDLSRNRQPAFV